MCDLLSPALVSATNAPLHTNNSAASNWVAGPETLRRSRPVPQRTHVAGHPTLPGTFFFRYQQRGRVDRILVGHYPATSLRQAYQAHADLTKRLYRGEAPRGTQTQSGRSGSSESSAQATPSTSPTVAELAAEFIRRYVQRERKRPLEAQQTMRRPPPYSRIVSRLYVRRPDEFRRAWMNWSRPAPLSRSRLLQRRGVPDASHERAWRRSDGSPI